MALIKRNYFFKARSRDFLCRLTFSGIVVSLLYGWFSGVAFHQLGNPALRFPFLDPVYWIAHLAKIPEYITTHFALALFLDLILLLIAVTLIMFPRLKFLVVIFFGSYLLYFISFNSFGAHHTSGKVGVLLMPIPFMFQQKRFSLLWQGMRYYALLIFSSAFLWKFVRLSWLYPAQGELILKKNLVAYLYFHEERGLTKIYRFLLERPSVLRISYLAGFLLEGSYLLGFFTKKMDGLLVAIFFILIGGFWFFADAFLGELLLFTIAFIPAKSEYPN